MADIKGLSLDEVEIQMLQNPNIGGIILFGRNYQSKKKLINLIQQIRNIKPNILIAVDHEGGRVQRFKDVGWTRIPAMAKLGEVYLNDEKLAKKMSYACGIVLASELLEVGIDFSFTPVLDINYENSSVIGDRAFSNNAKTICELSSKLISGMAFAGMKCVAKHFPGHGFVAADSHLELPIDNRSIDEINIDISVFKHVINQTDAIMPAHIIYSQIDDKPVCFSQIWLQDILRKKLGFKGVIFSDDMSMGGAKFAGNITQKVQSSINAGSDIVLICNNPKDVLKVIENDFGTSTKPYSMQSKKVANYDKTHFLNTVKSINNYLDLVENMRIKLKK